MLNNEQAGELCGPRPVRVVETYGEEEGGGGLMGGGGGLMGGRELLMMLQSLSRR